MADKVKCSAQTYLGLPIPIAELSRASALVQLSQVLGSGVLQGGELMALGENAPLLAQAIADEFGVTVGALKDLGARGELEIGRVFQAI